MPNDHPSQLTPMEIRLPWPMVAQGVEDRIATGRALQNRPISTNKEAETCQREFFAWHDDIQRFLQFALKDEKIAERFSKFRPPPNKHLLALVTGLELIRMIVGMHDTGWS